MAKEYKEGVDFEWVNAKDSKGNVVKDGKGNPVKTRRFFKKSEKEAMKTSPRPKARPEKKPAKKDDKKATNAVRPTPGGPGKLPAAKKPAPGGARPEPGKAGGMPAAKGKDDKKASAGMPVLGAAAAVAGRKAAQGRSYNPTYSGRGKAPEGFQGRYATEVGRPRAAGGARMIGGNPTRRALGAGGGRISNVPDKFRELINMNKGGMVKKPYKK